MKLKLPKGSMVLVAMAVAIVLVAIGLLSGDSGLLGNLIVIAIFVIVVPLFLTRYARFSWIKAKTSSRPKKTGLPARRGLPVA